MHYTLHQLQVFLTVAQHKSITKAAEAMSLTQPAISVQLKNLQDQFEIPLTEVFGRQLYVTDFGKEIATAAENILNQVYAINYKTMAFKGQLYGKLKIATVSTGKYVMPYFLSDFMKTNPAVDLVLDVNNRKKVTESLENNEVDFALVSVSPNDLKTDKIELMSNDLYIVANKNFEVHTDLSPQKLFTDNPVIFRENGSATRVAMENFLERNKIINRKKMELTSNEAVKQAVVAGLGISIMPIIGLKNELAMGDLQIIGLPNFPIVSMWSLVWLKNKKFSPVAQKYFDFILDKKTELVNEHFGWIDNF